MGWESGRSEALPSYRHASSAPYISGQTLVIVDSLQRTIEDHWGMNKPSLPDVHRILLPHHRLPPKVEPEPQPQHAVHASACLERPSATPATGAPACGFAGGSQRSSKAEKRATGGLRADGSGRDRLARVRWNDGETCFGVRRGVEKHTCSRDPNTWNYV